MSPDFWRGKKVLVTGHTGFKGAWLSLWLQSLGAQVSGFSLPPQGRSLFDAANVSDGMSSHFGDLRDAEAVEGTFAAVKPEIVIHMAAQALVRLSYRAPVETYSTNVLGLVHLYEAVRKTDSVRAVVNVTSDKCYENREWHWGYREDEPMGGFDPYSSSKGCAELVTAAYRRSFFNASDYERHGVALASARAGNVIGGGDWAQDRLVPDIMRALSRNEPVLIRHPHAIRPWQHVLEPLSGYLTLAERLYCAGPDFADGWNFGPDDSDAKPVQWIVETLTQLWGEDASWQLDAQLGPHEAHYLKLDCSKAKALLNWRPRWSLGTTLETIAEWYRAAQSENTMRRMTLNQIEAFSIKGVQ